MPFITLCVIRLILKTIRCSTEKMKTVSVQLKGELGPLVSLPDLVPRSRGFFCPRTAKTRSGDEISPSSQSADACLVILIYGFHTSPVLIPNPRKLSLMPIYCSTKKVYFAYYLPPHLEFVSGSLLLWEKVPFRVDH